MRFWVAAASALPHTDDVCMRVVDALLHMASFTSIRPHIPPVAWSWLSKQVILDSSRIGYLWGTHDDVTQTLRQLGDTELIASYLFVVWSERNHGGCKATQPLIKECCSGVHAMGRRRDLIHRLDYVLAQFDLGEAYMRRQGVTTDQTRFRRARQQYQEFRRELLELYEESRKLLTGVSRSATTFLYVTKTRTYRILLYIHVCTSPSMPVVV